MRSIRGGLLLAGSAVAAMGLPGCSKPKPPNVVLVVLDTMRSDYTGLTASRAIGSSVTPQLDRFGSSATVFPRAWSNAPWTVPSHATMFTGRLPSVHGCGSQSLTLPSNVPTLAEIVREHGYEPVAFFSNPWFKRRRTGLARGFETYPAEPKGADLWGGTDQGGEQTIQNVTNWLSRRAPERPFFLFVNLLESHLPYDPTVAYRQAHLPDLAPRDTVSVEWAHEFNVGLHPIQSIDWERVRRLYRGDVATTDTHFGELLQLLESRGVLRDAVVIVTADHGENLGEHEMMEHQYGVWETLLSVPLVVRAPGRLDPGVRDEPRSLTDLFATVLDAAGIKGVQIPKSSHSLLQPLGADGAKRVIAGEYDGATSRQLEILKSVNPAIDVARFGVGYVTVRVGDLRLTVGSDGSTKLHDLAADPWQERDLSAERPEDVERLRRLLPSKPTGFGQTPDAEGDHEEELDEQLRSLGYIG